MYKKILLPILIALSEDDAEKAHELILKAGRKIQKSNVLLLLVRIMCQARRHNHPVTLLGRTFPNWVGLAAGLDKNGEILRFLEALGFGFLSFGSVLPRPQRGNDRPRAFRLADEHAVINRFGFNSQGVVAVTENLYDMKPKIRIPLMGSLGKMKDTPNDEAIGDYLTVMEYLWDIAEIFVANVSSPNTPGLRDLQERRQLENLIGLLARAAKEKAARLGVPPKALLVKLAPDLSDAQLAETIEVGEQQGVDGLILGNTTVSRDCLRNPNAPLAQEKGGLSGEPLYNLMLSRVQFALSHTRLPIIGVGGISDFSRAKRLKGMGVPLIKIHTPLIYGGWNVVQELKQAGLAA